MMIKVFGCFISLLCIPSVFGMDRMDCDVPIAIKSESEWGYTPLKQALPHNKDHIVRHIGTINEAGGNTNCGECAALCYQWLSQQTERPNRAKPSEPASLLIFEDYALIDSSDLATTITPAQEVVYIEGNKAVNVIEIGSVFKQRFPLVKKKDFEDYLLKVTPTKKGYVTGIIYVECFKGSSLGIDGHFLNFYKTDEAALILDSQIGDIYAPGEFLNKEGYQESEDFYIWVPDRSLTLKPVLIKKEEEPSLKMESDKSSSSDKVCGQDALEKISLKNNEYLAPGWTIYKGYKTPPEPSDVLLSILLNCDKEPNDDLFKPAINERKKHPSWCDYWVAMMKCHEENTGRPFDIQMWISAFF